MKIYRAVVEPCFWYAAPAWMPWVARTGLERLERAQREALRAVAGLPRSTPIEAIHLETEVDPVGVEGRRRALVRYEKALRGREPQVWQQVARRRLKANKGLREQAREEVSRLLPEARAPLRWVRRPPWRNIREAGVSIFPEMRVRVGKEESEEARRREALGTMEARGRGPWRSSPMGQPWEGFGRAGLHVYSGRVRSGPRGGGRRVCCAAPTRRSLQR